MFQYLIRFAKRFAILLPGIVIAYFSLQDIFPYFNQRLPLGLAIVATYALAAYVLIPGIIRLIRVIRPPDHLPLYCVTPDGFASDPLNVGIVGTRRELIIAMQNAGWHQADKHSLRNVLRLALSVLLDHSYPNAPVSSLYLFGRKQDIAFELPVPGGTSAERHHVRFWATTYDDAKRFHIRAIHWQHRKTHVFGDNLMWVGAASLDVGITFIRHNFQLTHMIDPDTNNERELIVDQIKSTSKVRRTTSIKLDNPYRLTNRVWKGSLHSDGRMTIIEMAKNPVLSQSPTARHTRNRSRSKS